MKKLILLGMMLSWGGVAAAQDGAGYPDQCAPSASPVIAQTDVATVERNSDTNSAVIQIDVAASLPNGEGLTYAFSSSDGAITSDGASATWTVSGAGPFTANVAVTAPSGCKAHARLTYHMEQTATQ